MNLLIQEGAAFQDTTLNRLAVYKDERRSGGLVCGGRFQIFNELLCQS